MENDKDFQKLLRFNAIMEAQKPVPCAPNFYEEFYVRSRQTDDSASTTSSNTNFSAAQASTTAKVVQHLLKSNEQLIEKAAMQQAASGVNVTTQQYTNLIPISFDQEQFIREAEAAKRKK